MSALLERLRDLMAKATGPFYLLDQPWLKEGDTSLLVGSPDPHVAKFIADFSDWGESEDDEPIDKWAYAALIEESLNALPQLLDRLEAAEKALKRIAEINNGPDRASGEWRCTEAANLARAALNMTGE